VERAAHESTAIIGAYSRCYQSSVAQTSRHFIKRVNHWNVQSFSPLREEQSMETAVEAFVVLS
jgi:hypothetical protein